MTKFKHFHRNKWVLNKLTENEFTPSANKLIVTLVS